MDLSINYDFFNNYLNLYSNPYPKINFFFFFILNNLIRNLQKICKTPKPETLILKKLKTQTIVKSLGFIGCICLAFSKDLKRNIKE